MPMALGFDYGLSRIGVATGQTLTKTASPLTALAAKDGIPVWTEVGSLLESWAPDVVVVGLPLHEDGSLSDMGVRARKFGQRLHGRFGVAVAYVDEHRSTREARQLTGYRGQAGAQSGALDAAAAAIILERWLGAHDD